MSIQNSLNVGITTLHVRPGRSGSHEPYLVNLVKALAEIETPHCFTLFVTPVNRRLFSYSNSNFQYVTYPSIVENVWVRIFSEQFVLPFDAFRRRIDLIHYGGTASSIFLRRSDVVTIHHDSVTQRNSMSRLRNFYFDVVLRINRRAGKLIVPTRTYADQMVEYYGYHPHQMRPVHHGASARFVPLTPEDASNVQRKWGIEKQYILSVTNTLPHKNVPNLINAFDQLYIRHGIDPQLVLIGNVDQDRLAQIVEHVSDDPDRLSKRIRVIPFMPHDDLPPLYGAASAFAFVSQAETFGMPLVEAMACGLPIVASDIPVHQEIVQNAALTVDPNDVEGISNALHLALTDDALRDKLSASALETAWNFTWLETAMQTIRVYEEAVAK